jgi:signal transduction histidine kinase
LGLINTVLDISKIEGGQFKLNLGEYGLGSIVATVMVATESLAATKKLAIKTEVAKGLPYRRQLCAPGRSPCRQNASAARVTGACSNWWPSGRSGPR